MPNVTFASPESFISKLEARKHLALSTISRLVPNISKSSTYKRIMTPSLLLNLLYMHLSTPLITYPCVSITLSNFSCHCLGAYYKPDKDLTNL